MSTSERDDLEEHIAEHDSEPESTQKTEQQADQEDPEDAAEHAAAASSAVRITIEDTDLDDSQAGADTSSETVSETTQYTEQLGTTTDSHQTTVLDEAGEKGPKAPGVEESAQLPSTDQAATNGQQHGLGLDTSSPRLEDPGRHRSDSRSTTASKATPVSSTVFVVNALESLGAAKEVRKDKEFSDAVQVALANVKSHEQAINPELIFKTAPARNQILFSSAASHGA